MSAHAQTMSARAAWRKRRAAPVVHLLDQIDPAAPVRFAQMRAEITEALGSRGGPPKAAHVLYSAIESWVGVAGGSREVPQAAIYRKLKWSRSYYFVVRAWLIELGLLRVSMPLAGKRHGPGALRRLTLLQRVPKLPTSKRVPTRRPRERKEDQRLAAMVPDIEARLIADAAPRAGPAT
jgi:hypothetical protein